ncbi:hypothetical protein JCM10908_001082 [Rhodotorula pacifica]|uniref:uncharacterized protein n=1 Tax=Rhodotorula pacifica TaxID=1495444 RepID=UPI003179CC4C
MASVHLSSALKALIASPQAQGGVIPAPSKAAATALFEGLASSAQKHGLGTPAWLTLGSAALVTLNSPDTLCALYSFARARSEASERAARSVEYAGIMRETGLKTISFSGIPRAINNLGALRAHIEQDVASKLPTEPSRRLKPADVEAMLARGDALWNGIYDPHSKKLLAKLAQSHPDLPVHILTSHYSHLLSDPPTSSRPAGAAKVGRILTSVVAIACLRAQGGVGPQVTSHVFGLRKAAEEKLEGDEVIQGGDFLTSEEGAKWAIEQVDRFVEVLARGPSFATRAKL